MAIKRRERRSIVPLRNVGVDNVGAGGQAGWGRGSRRRRKKRGGGKRERAGQITPPPRMGRPSRFPPPSPKIEKYLPPIDQAAPQNKEADELPLSTLDLESSAPNTAEREKTNKQTKQPQQQNTKQLEDGYHHSSRRVTDRKFETKTPDLEAELRLP